MTSKAKALRLAEAASAKKGLDVRILDLRGIPAFTDFFVIVTGRTDRHVLALCEGALESMREIGERPLGVEGESTARWVLIDLGDVLVHIFQREAREFYALERLWGEAEALDLPRAAEA
ncbi:MAG: ribosome silencing factor [Myxococcota bacterium]